MSILSKTPGVALAAARARDRWPLDPFTGHQIAPPNPNRPYKAVKAGTRIPQAAYRVVFIDEVGPIPDGAILLRTCNEPFCIASAHRQLVQR